LTAIELADPPAISCRQNVWFANDYELQAVQEVDCMVPRKDWNGVCAAFCMWEACASCFFSRYRNHSHGAALLHGIRRSSLFGLFRRCGQAPEEPLLVNGFSRGDSGSHHAVFCGTIGFCIHDFVREKCSRDDLLWHTRTHGPKTWKRQGKCAHPKGII